MSEVKKVMSGMERLLEEPKPPPFRPEAISG